MTEPAPPTQRPDTASRVTAWIMCALILAVYWSFKQYSYRPLRADENIYFYAAKILAEAKAWPYRDYFFAHPPVQLLVAAGVFLVCGPSFFVAKSIPIAAGALSGVAVFLIARCRFGHLAAVISMVAFLLSYGVLRNSSHYTGVNLAVALMLWGFFLMLRRHAIWGGILLALSAQTAVYAVPAILMMLFWRLLEAPRQAGRAAMACVSAYVAVTLMFWIPSNGRYLEQVFTWHLHKQGSTLELPRVLSRVFRFHNFHLAWASALAAVCLVWRTPRGAGPAPHPAQDDQRRTAQARPQAKRKARPTGPRRRGRTSPAQPAPRSDRGRRARRAASWAATREGFAVGMFLFLAAYLLWMTRLREWYDYYLMVLFPPLALLAGYVASHIWLDVCSGAGARTARCLVLCLLYGAGFAWVQNSQREQFYAGQEGPFQTYQATWHDAPTLGRVNTIYRRLFWHDARHVEREYLALTYYLWHEMIFIPDVEGAVQFVRSHSGPQDRLFGESGLAPLIAFLADRDIAGYVVDTNTKRLMANQTTAQRIIEQIDTPALRFVVGSRTAQRHRYINRRIATWLDRNFSIVYRFDSDAGSSVTNVVLERNTPSP